MRGATAVSKAMRFAEASAEAASLRSNEEASVRNRTLGSLVLGLAVVLGAATPALAQGRPFNFMAGISFLNTEGETGVGADVYIGQAFVEGTTVNVGWVGNFGVHSFDFATQTSLFGGVNIMSATGGTVTPYGEFLIGVELCCDDSFFGFKLGGGVKFNLNEKLDLFGAYHFRRTSVEGISFTGNEFTFGIATRFGG